MTHLLPSSLVIMLLSESLTESLALSEVQMVVRLLIASVIVLSTSVFSSLFSGPALGGLGAAVAESVQMEWPTVMMGVLDRSSRGLENISRSGTTSVVGIMWSYGDGSLRESM